MSAVHEIGAALMRRPPPETAHRATRWVLSRGLGPHPERADDPVLATELWGRRFANPIGIAAGFDKNAVAMGALAALGVGFVEVGGVTPEPQPGNPRPRLFRLPADQAVINRMGFNSDGAQVVVARLAAGRAGLGVPVGVNLAANTESADPARDFERLVRLMGPLADFLTVDISCPNTANGQLFLSPVPLRELLARLADCRPAETTLLVKLSPDVTEAGLEALVEVIANARVDG
ncbi:MAG: dihydroorotate dehydrogenase 2, partial [Alphaproteobacteria bacterium]